MRSFQDYLIIDGQAVPFEPLAVLEGASDTVFYAVETNVNVWGVRWKVYGQPIGPDAGFIERDYTVNGQTKRLKVWSVALTFGQHWVCMTGADTAFGDQVKFEYRQVNAVTVIPALGVVGNLASIEGRTISTTRGGLKGVEVVGDGVTLRDIKFTDNGGFLVSVAGNDCTIDGMEAGTFFDYALYVGAVRNAVIKNVRIIGGSTNESCIRLAGVDGLTLDNVEVDYTASPRKATLRGYGTNITVKNCKFNGHNSTVGLTPMSYEDGGSGNIAGGKLQVNQAPYDITVYDKAAWMAAVKQSIAEGRREHADILADVLNKVPVRWQNPSTGTIVNIPVSSVDQGKTVQFRIKGLGQRTEATFSNCQFIDTPIRNSAGGTQRYTGCNFAYGAGVDVFTGWNENVYPPAELALPKDIKRPAPVTVFERCDFTSASWTRKQFIDFAAANNITLLSCGFNGVALETSGVS